MNQRVLYTLLSALFILLGTTIAIGYARGNFRFTKNGFVANSGLLAANSFPPGAQLYLNDKLVTATDDTLYVEPGEYAVKIVKEGYSPWQKTLRVESELVTQTNAQLFPSTPSLSPLTSNGAEKPIPSPDGQKLLFFVATGSGQLKNGLYVLELNNNLLALNRQPRQILSDSSQQFDFGQASYIWSPDSNQVMVLADTDQVVIDISKQNDLPSLTDIGFRRSTILSEWQEEMYLRERQFLRRFPAEILNIATQSATNVYISPDKKRLLYTATESLTLPSNLVPPLPSISSQPQSRQLEPGFVYVYDREEDTNFAVGFDQVISDQLATTTTSTGAGKQLLAIDALNNAPLSLAASPSAFVSLQAESIEQTAQLFNQYHTPLYTHGMQWFPDSKHLLFSSENSIKIKAYDNTNETNLFSGVLVDGFIFPWPDGSRVVFITTFSPDVPNNLYSLELR